MLPYQVSKLDRKFIKSSIGGVKWRQQGKVVDVVGTIIEAHLPECQLGTLVDIKLGPGKPGILAEVVGFREDRVLLIPFSGLHGIAPGCQISKHSLVDTVPCGDYLLGRVVDSFLTPIDGSALSMDSKPTMMPIDRDPPNPISRERISGRLGLGIKAIDSLLTLGNGQRIGVMAGSGVGKSVLMGMIARDSEADINVIALIGERGREVREFLEKDLGEEGLRKSVVVVVTSDQSPLMKIRGAKIATSIAEYFSTQGKSVLFMMDSLTRVAMAQREIGLAVGEPPTTKGYTPSVFSLLPRLLERSGPQRPGEGCISGLYTVLVDGDDFNDPIADASRSILDGQINLVRRLASRGHFPAIDVSTSISRVMNDIVSDEHRRLATRIKSLMGVYEENIDLVQIGAYQRGTNPELDLALQLMPRIETFLKQDIRDRVSFEEAISQALQIFSEPQESAA